MICRTLKLRPILECVLPCGDGDFTAIFGYQNDEPRTVVVRAGGPDNFFRPAPRDRGQPTRFLPGRHRNVFSVHGTNNVFWTLAGRTVRARGNFAPCETDFAGTDAPLALLPVRIEARYFPFGATAPTQLLVRIYPDDVHVDSHEPEINDDELAFGNAFWADFGITGSDPAADDQRRHAWAVLADRYGPRRAAWIARVLAPGAPAPGRRDSSWTRAATSSVLPTRWVALGYLNGKRVFANWGKRLPTIVQVGPSPNAAPGAGDVEPEIKWLTDFDAAVDIGMGIRVDLDSSIPRLDRLVVLGSKGGCDRGRGAALLNSVLDAHHYTDGLAVIPQATPTNNSDGEPAGYASKDPGQGRSFDAERGDPLFVSGDGSDGDVLSSLLGIGDQTLAHVDGTGGLDQQDARAMNALLWEPTFGYFFKQMIAGTASDAEIATVRRHFIDNVRGRGPLPIVRIGRQPYGLLPATSLDAFKPLTPGAVPSPSFSNARAQLQLLRGIWSDSVAGVPTVKTTSPDAATAITQLVQAMAMEPVSTSMEGRFLFAQNYVTAFNDFLGLWADSFIGTILGIIFGIDPFNISAPDYFQSVSDSVRAVLPTVKSSGRLLGVTYNADAFALSYALTGGVPSDLTQQPSGLLSETDPYGADQNPFTAVRTLTYQALRTYSWPAAAGVTPLLPRLVRNGKLLEYAAISGTFQVERGQLTAGDLVEPAFVDLGTTTSHTLGRLLDDQIPNLTAPATVGGYLDGLTEPPGGTQPSDPHLANLLEFLDAAGDLEGRPTAAIDRVFRELLDTCSYRLDAWVTSLATARIRALRAKHADGIYLGGYGWVDDLRPASRQAKVEGGFMLAPSLNHAATAAILRNGRLSHNPTAVDNAFAVNLSSQRVRRARALVDGVRQGNSLAAMLGYQIERALKENYPTLFLEGTLANLRQVAPLAVNQIPETASTDGTTSVEDLGAANVVDGQRLRDLFHDPNANALHTLLNGLGTNERAAVTTEIGNLDDAADALGDLALAEFVYQMARGNHARAAAALDAFGRAEALPPEMQVIETPRSGVANTYRLLVLFSGTAGAPTGWGAPSPRALAEPQLNAWAAKLLGSPSSVEARVEFRDQDNQPLPPAPPNVKLSDLGLSPLDVVDMARPGEAGSPSDLERLWANRLSVPAGATVVFDLGRDPTWGPERVSVGELFELARRVRELFGICRAAAPADLATPDDTPAGADTTELAARADAAIGSLRAATAVLAAIDPDTSSLNSIRGALLSLLAYGVPGAVPALPIKASDPTVEDQQNRAALGVQIPFVLKEAQRRIDKHDALVAAFDPTGQPEEILVAQHTARLNIVFGPAFRPLARLRPANASALAQAATIGAATSAATPFVGLTWFQRMARVRDGAARLDDVLFYAETLATGDAPHLQILQLPPDPSDPWIGLPLASGTTARAGRVSIIAHAPGTLDLTAPLSGLIIDHWMDVIPNAVETAAAAFHYDRPNATAPQAILLAVTPVPQATWDLDTLEAVVLETIALSQIRAVDPHSIQKVRHVLPAIYLAHNLANATISVNTD